MGLVGKSRDCVVGSQIVFFSIEDAGGYFPLDWIGPDVTQILPGKCLSKVCGDRLFVMQLILGHVGPSHHIHDKFFHVHYGGNKVGFFDLFAGSSVHGKKGADAVGDQVNGIVARTEFIE